MAQIELIVNAADIVASDIQVFENVVVWPRIPQRMMIVLGFDDVVKAVVENGKSQTPSVVAVNNDWKSWQLAAKAAKKIETRNVLDVPAQKPVAKKDDNQMKKDNQSEQVKALINQGKKQMRAMQYEKARGYFLEAVDSGSVEANYQMGMLYINSNYDGHNREMAKNYFLKAATLSHVEAQYQLGLLYIGRDKDTARKWLRLAAGAGHEEARRRLLSLNK